MDPQDAEEYTQALGQVVAGSWRQVALGKRLGVPQALGITTEEWVQDRLGGYVRLSIPERREAVAELTEEGMSTREIGDVLGVDNATVHRDQHAVADATPEPEQAAMEATLNEVPVADATPESEPLAPAVDIQDTDLGRLAGESPNVRQARAAKEFAKAVAATTALGPQLDHVVTSILAVDGKHSLESAENCIRIWNTVAATLAEAQTLRRVK
jgi:hypothetical protein